jgi:iron-sulfur cluster repair protein YtfE (RIC family)
MTTSKEHTSPSVAGPDVETVGDWPTSRPSALAAELRWVHDMLRRDMGIVQELTSRVSSGTSAAEVAGELHDLQTSQPLFKLRTSCLTLCQILDSHHQGEDAALFPAVRRAAPQLAATVDQLEEDHRRVASLIDDVETLAGDLDDPRSRSALVDALRALSTTLLDHLDFEEKELQPVLESWQTWPGRP